MSSTKLTLLLMLTLLVKESTLQCPLTKPNIVVIIADDVGHNDIGLRGSNQIPTPNLDALGYNGIILDKFYTQASCTPSRAAFLTGNYPIRTGLQGTPIVAGQNRSLPRGMPVMPEIFKKLGYETHLVGKWHLGSAYRSSTPTNKGFDTHFGYWNGFLGYFDYLTDFNSTKMEGFDLHNRLEAAWSDLGKYATSLFTDKAVEIIDNHNQSQPMFLVVSHLAGHAGRDGIELGVPDAASTKTKYPYISDPRRRLYAEIVNLLDKSVGTIVKRLAQRNMLENSIVLFFSDNGAPTLGPYANTGSNWPLRGIKLTNFEGAIRGTGLIYSPLLDRTGYVSKELIHISDWLPTFYAAAGGDPSDLGGIDGINQWEALSKNRPTKRTEILVDIDEINNMGAVIAHNGRYKLVTGVFEKGKFDGYYGDSGRSDKVPPYDIDAVLTSDVNVVIQNITDSAVLPRRIRHVRSELNLSWCRNEKSTPGINCSDSCLFDLEIDPSKTVEED
ncbi:hypothetical protein GEV33_005910 [Tenebrio molitor]|uniref:Sulfatase N-terminal domain-containing protein n=1 Tax=Tenebrio molitor TaxID=7067 RepID=A0A8J6HMU9_TENMO|nr:hypothetical protein GEV33_005910 [Tenebrio molitor]